MNHEQWKLWKPPTKATRESLLRRYGVAMVLPLIAALVVYLRSALTETPFFVFLGVIVLSAANGGLAPAFVSTALSSLLIRLLFIHPVAKLHYGGDFEGMEQMVGFVLVAILVSSFVAGLRRERNHLLDSEERYRLLAETASDAIIVIDEQGEILYVNPVAEKIFGGQASQLLGQNLNLLLPGDGFREQLTNLKRSLDTRKKAVAVQLPARHQSGEHLLVEMTLGTTSHRGKNIFTAIIRDLTSHNR
ncbi:MAG: PAS domain S-box protein [Verrucomicrobia bacterium]|nr:PAS domain S-box protein [Verrucomicrobiota bacterium]